MKKFLLIIVLPIFLLSAGIVALSLKKDVVPKSFMPFGQQDNTSQTTTSQTQTGVAQNTDPVRWEFTGETWKAMRTPPACPAPIKLGAPVDIDLVTAMLYPGQTRNNSYKAHGGFAFSSITNNTIVVKAPLEAHLVKASRYIEQGEVQYLLVFISDCGIMYRFDHLLELTPKYQKIANGLPEPKANDSRTTPINPPVPVAAGEAISTAVGFRNTKNVTVDFGVYDLRKKNGITKPNDKEHAPYGICWLDYFSPATTNILKSLPARNQAHGKNSDYCK